MVTWSTVDIVLESSFYIFNLHLISDNSPYDSSEI